MCQLIIKCPLFFHTIFGHDIFHMKLFECEVLQSFDAPEIVGRKARFTTLLKLQLQGQVLQGRGAYYFVLIWRFIWLGLNY